MSEENKESVTKGNESVNESQFIDTKPTPTTESKTADKPTEQKVESKPSDDTNKTQKPDDKIKVDFNDFLGELGEAGQEDTAEDKARKEKESKESKTEDVVEDKKEDTKVSDTKVDSNARDYNDIEEADRPLFKKMGNEAFAKAKELYTQNKQFKADIQEKDATLTKLKSGALPDSYYEHERGYMLTPEFEQAANTVNKASVIVDHWYEQLKKVKEGDETYQEIHLDKNGEFFLTKPIKADKESVNLIESYLDGSKNQLTKFQYSIQKIAELHKTKSGDSVKQIRDFENKAFPQFLKPENAKILDPLIKDLIKNEIPTTYQSNPLAQSYAKALITIRQLGNLVNDLKKGANGKSNGDGKAKENKEDQEKLSPNNSDMSAGDDGARKNTVTMEDFNEYTSRR